MMKKLFFFILPVILVSCAHTSKKAAKIPEGKSSLYYYLVSNLEAMEGNSPSSLFYLDKSLKKNPGSSFLITQKSYQLARQNKLDEALKLSLKSFEKNPRDADLAILIGKIYTTKQQPELAIIYYQKAVALSPTNEEAATLLTREYITTQRIPLAVITLKKFIEASPESLSAYFFLANIYATQMKDYAKALKTYQSLLGLDPDDTKVLGLIAEVHLARKDYVEALKTLLALQALTPTDLNIQMRIGLLYYELKDLNRATQTFESLIKLNPNLDKIHYYLGLLYQEKQDFKAAVAHLALIPPASEFYPDAVTRQAVMYQKIGETDHALTAAMAALNRQPLNPDFYDLVSSLYSIKHDYGKALSVLKSGLLKLPKNEHLLFATGVIYEKMGNSESLAWMKKILEINPENVLALNFIGYTYAEQGKNLGEAKAMIEKAAKLKPDDGFIIDSLGWVYFQTGNAAKALELLKKAERLSPKEPTILEHLGDVYLARKDKSTARAYYEKSLFALTEEKDRDKKENEQMDRLRKKIGSL